MAHQVSLKVCGPVIDFTADLGVTNQSFLPVLLQGAGPDVEDFLGLLTVEPSAPQFIARRLVDLLLDPGKLFPESLDFVDQMFSHFLKNLGIKVACIGGVSCRRTLVNDCMCLNSGPNVGKKSNKCFPEWPLVALNRCFPHFSPHCLRRIDFQYVQCVRLGMK